jgi:hypothetical protein
MLGDIAVGVREFPRNLDLDRPRQCAAQLELNCDGSACAQEIRRAEKLYGIELVPMKHFFDTLDDDGSGSISFTEMNSWYRGRDLSAKQARH